MEIIITILLLGFAMMAFGQNNTADAPAKPVAKPIKVSLLSSYYGQEGEHGAVNGGIGSQLLNSFTQEGAIYIPVRDSSAVKLHGGVDYFTSASMLDIDKYQTSASSGTSDVSGNETRGFASVGVDWKGKNNLTHSPSLGFSMEYDVLSFNGGYGISKFFPKKGITYNAGTSFIADRWMVVYPGEFRDASQDVNAGTEYVTGASGYGYGGGTYGSGTTGSGTTGSGTTGSGTTGSGTTGSGTTGSGTTGSGTTGSGTTGSGGGSGGSGGGSGSGGSIVTIEDNFANKLNSGSYGTGSTAGSSTGSGSSSYNTGQQFATAIPLSGKTITKDGRTYPVDWRYSASLSNAISFPINKRMNAMVGIDNIVQWGLLSTPFYRVYFNDGVTEEMMKEVRIEKLPRLRVKTAVYGRYNFFVNSIVGIRVSGRYYYDNWDIHAIALTAELPIRATKWLSIDPFYRFYWQTESKYFNKYSEASYQPNTYYTSDYDLSGFTAHKIGAAVRIAPLKPMLAVKNNNTQRNYFAFRSVGLRYAHYMRSDGLSANVASLELDFEF